MTTRRNAQTGNATPSKQWEPPPSSAQSASKSSGGGCYIATAVYGSYESPEVVVLRHFRDSSLSQTVLGRVFIRLCFWASPPVARHFGGVGILNRASKWVLDRIVGRIDVDSGARAAS